MLLRVLLVLISLPLLIYGGDGLYVAWRDREIEQIACEDYLDGGTQGSWVRIAGCKLDYLNAGFSDTSGPLERFLPGSGLRISELLFPVRADGADATEPVHLVVSARNPLVLALAEETLVGAGRDDQESFLVTMLQVVTAMRASKQIDGTLRRPLHMLLTRGSMSTIPAPLAEDFAVLDLDQRPGTLRPALAALAGIAALSFVVFRSRRTSHPASVSTRTGPQLMLLNLRPLPSVRDIEHAPPLGSQDVVRSLMVMSLPGIEFDAQGRGTFTVRSGAVEVDLRADDPVYTAVLTVRGSASPAVARLLEETGWQAYAPKAGVFVGINDLRPGEPR